MAKCNRDTHPNLFAYLEAYGLDEGIIKEIDRVKTNGHYVLVGWKQGDEIHMLDLSPTPDEMQRDYRDGSSMAKYGLNMLNDGMWPSITEKEWNKVKLHPYLEHFTIKGHKEYGL